MVDTKVYLGDSVYADFNGYGVTLTTENGYGPSNTIYMEPSVLAALFARIAANANASRREVPLARNLESPY